MTEPELTIEQFIHSYLETVDQLRAFLLLCGPGKEGMTAIELASKLYIQMEAAAAILGRLEDNGLVSSGGDPPRFRGNPRTPALAALAQQVVILDRERPVTLLNALYARPQGIQAFTDAFKLRKEKGG